MKVVVMAALAALVALSGCTAAPRVYTPDELGVAAAGLLNKNVTVRGVAVMHTIICTQAACPPGECCNTCGAPLSLAGETVKVRLRGSYDLRPVGCAGSECSQACYPLEIGQRYEVDGMLRDDGTEYYIEFISFRQLASEDN